MPTKDRAAQRLGRRGGLANTPGQRAARARNIAKAGGRPPEYRIVDHPRLGRLLVEHREGADWRPLETFSTASLVYLTKWLRANKAGARLRAFENGVISYVVGNN
jgi:hypothetical protein